MSGPAPETERERQLRELANRLVTHTDPAGPVTVDLLPIGYPDDLPPELVNHTDLRFLGSAVRRRAGDLTEVELAFEGPGEPNLVLEKYAAELLRVGGCDSNKWGRSGAVSNCAALAIWKCWSTKARQRW